MREVRGSALARGRLGQTEVENLDPSVVRHEDVVGLQVAVDDSLAVGRGEAGGDLSGPIGRSADRRNSVGKDFSKRLALEELHDGIGRLTVRSEIEDGEDVRVVQRRNRVRLALEARERVGVLRERFRKHFDRDIAMELRVLRAVNLSHPPGTQGGEDLVGTEFRTGRKRHGAYLIPSMS